MATREEILQELTIDDLSQDMRMLAECIGIEATRKAISELGGLRFNIPMTKSYKFVLERYMIKVNKSFDNYGLKKIAKAFEIGEQLARRAYYKASLERARLKKLQAEANQIKLFDK